MTLRETAYFWVGTNANLFFVSVGVIAFELGLSVWQALVAVVLGTLLFAAVALASIGGVRSGLPTMTFTRAVFGPRGNLPHAVLAWADVGRVRGHQLHLRRLRPARAHVLPRLGSARRRREGRWRRSSCSGRRRPIAIYGHATMVYLQRVFAVALTLVLLLVLAYAVGGVRLVRRAGPATWRTGTRVPRILAAGAVIAVGPDLLPFNAADWVRYLPSRTSAAAHLLDGPRQQRRDRRCCLSVMGVLLASRGDMSDPIAGVEPFVPGLAVRALHPRCGRRLDRQQRRHLLLVRAVPAVARPAAEALPGDRARRRWSSTAMVLYILFVAGLHDRAARLRRADGRLARARSRRCGSPTA